ncbi:MAG: glycoside hydrolase family 28 protein [Terracidiphilus sp.]
MAIKLMERRDFLKTAAQGVLAAPVLVSLEGFGVAQTAKAAGAKAAAHRAAPVGPAGPKVTLNVRDLGATGDGKTKDTEALQQTIDRCSVLGGGSVTVPAGDYLTGTLVLHSGVTLHIEDGASLLGSPDMADYPLAQVRWEGKWIKGYSALISAMDSDDIGIVGPGKIVGSPAIRGRVERSTHLRLPALIEFTNCRNVSVTDCFTSQAGMWSIHPTYCENVTFKNVTVESGADGIDVDSCRQVTIDGCDFKTGDDCISLKSGRGEEGNTINRPTVDVRIANCTFADAWFACIGIGSETSAGIREVHIDHCKCVGARSYAIYIKTRVGRGAFIEDIYANDIDVSGAKQGFLRLNFINSGKKDEFPVPGGAGVPAARDLRFTNIHVEDVPVLVKATEIDPLKPLVGFTLENVTGTCGEGIFLANIKQATIRNIKVTGFTGPLLSVENVTGVGLAGAAKLEAAKMPKIPEPIAAPAAAYQLR